MFGLALREIAIELGGDGAHEGAAFVGDHEPVAIERDEAILIEARMISAPASC